MKLVKVISTGVALLSTMSVLANGFQASRCANWGDNLTQPQATERWHWAWKCDAPNRQILMMGKQYKDPNGSTRPAYPIYGVLPASYDGEPSNPKKWFPPKSRNAGCSIPENYTIVGFCVGGCYTADQFISLSEMDLPIAEALRSNEVAIKTLDEDSSLESLKYKEGKVSMYIKSIISGKHEIMKIATETGKEIKVTLEHPLVNENGAFVEAGAVEVGSYLMNEFGEAEKVVSVEKTEIEGKVYNLETEGQKMTDKVIAAQGLLNGDVRVQNSKAAKLNQVLLRTNLIPQELLK
jgi:hypothetical protein